MKILLTFPPPASPVSPYLSTPLLCGQLVQAGFDATCLDLSVEFFNHIFSSSFLENSYNKAIAQKKALSSFGPFPADLKLSEFKKKTKKEQGDILKLKFLENIPSKEELQNIIANIEENKLAYKNPDIFYDYDKIQPHYLNMQKALQVATLPYTPAQLHYSRYLNPLFKSNYKDITYQVEDIENNIFYDFFKLRLKEINIKDYDLVCISSPNLTQLMPSLTLCKVIKELSSSKIVIGGNIINRLDKQLKNISEAFDKYYDYISIGCGEDAIVSLAKAITTSSYAKIKGLIYRNSKGKIIYNEPDYNYDISKSAPISLRGIELSNYYTPDIIFPIQATKGCYWGKCLFCGLHYPKKTYCEKPISVLVDEIEELQKSHSINHFEFIDEALKPSYLSEFADEILKRKIKINYYICSRIEKDFTSELCKKLKKSGLVLVQFGFESASKKIYKKLNKGIPFDNRLDIVKRFAQNNIWTYLYAIIGFPNETEEEALKTINLKSQNPNIINSIFIHSFWLDVHSPIKKKTLLCGISPFIDIENNDFEQSIKNFHAFNILSKKKVSNLIALNNELNPQLKNSFFAPDEYFFLYVYKWGKEINNILTTEKDIKC